MESIIGVRGQTTTVPQARLSAQIIGTLGVRRGEEVLGSQELGGPKCRQILEILLLQLGRPVSKSRLIELLWEGEPPNAAVSTLESYVSVLRRRLQPGMGKSGPLRTTTGGYVLDRAWVDLDLDRFETRLHAAEHSEPAVAYGLLTEALALATGPLLGNEFLPNWAESERHFHASRTTAARVLAAETALGLGKLDEAAGWAHAVIDAEPLNESAWTVLVLSSERAGRPVEGLRTYESCRRLLSDELGCAPGPVLRDAQARMLKATAEAQSEFGDVLAALLTLQDRMSAGGVGNGADDGESGTRAGSSAWRDFQEAGVVVRRYLQRAMAVA